MLHDHLCSSGSAISRQVIVVPDGSSLTVIMDYDSDEDDWDDGYPNDDDDDDDFDK